MPGTSGLVSDVEPSMGPVYGTSSVEFGVIESERSLIIADEIELRVNLLPDSNEDIIPMDFRDNLTNSWYMMTPSVKPISKGLFKTQKY